MSIIGKPRNLWGWGRIISLGLFTGALAWGILAAILRAVGEISWMKWSGYMAFSLPKSMELALVFLISLMLTGWLEVQDHQAHVERTNEEKAKRERAKIREDKLGRIRKAVEVGQLGSGHHGAETPLEARQRIADTVRAELDGLDGRGKGELLLFLLAKKLIATEADGLDLSHMDFSGVILDKAVLNHIRLVSVDLTKAILNGAHLANACLSGSNLTRAQLRHAYLKKADLSNACLDQAHLNHANLTGADLSNATFRGAMIIGADLRGCIWNGFSNDEIPLEKRSMQEFLPKELAQSILIDVTINDGQKITNENGRRYLAEKELSELVDRL